MRYWTLIFFLLPLAGIAYATCRIWRLMPFGMWCKVGVMIVLTLCLACFFIQFSSLDRLPLPVARAIYETGNSSLFILLYVVMALLVMDALRIAHVAPKTLMVSNWATTLALAVGMTLLFTGAYFHYLHKARQPLQIETAKELERPLKIVMLADLHLGYHNGKEELQRWVGLINAEHPDLVLIGGDIIDRSAGPLFAQRMQDEFRRISAPVYACFGNHEYYSGHDAAIDFYKAAGINVLNDTAVTACGINIVGRDDFASRHRRRLADLTAHLDKRRFTIVIDHEPHHLEEAGRAGADFQFSGHTHYGQVWPISWIENAIYEDAYGPLQKGQTQYYVTSGMGIWGAKFRIGTRSEYVVLDLIPKKES
ncbi:MAG: metallophosphoesterase [Bacteroidales bacterium]|nr:metallophosphoesterase [Bacteroidales bacterium]MCI7652910.1 metallophosphoesterase [Bacteroidales bacterium]MDD7705066.1 metallophosphoesterase [Bacteroidales bacterium]MDY4704900.1 metallophosphoesterase [Prevotella sp.]MDY5320729.1 metallophosphoesterase [Prevotella sp.]